MKSNSIIIYTDGSSLGNPGPGGYGCVIVFTEKELVVELGAYENATTNNKMELTAILTALEYLKKNNISSDAEIVIHTDSSYAINGITKWIFGWQKNNWITSTKTPVLNEELWKQLISLKNYFKSLSFEHVRGHSGIWGNERCDMIATSFASKSKIDLFHGKLSQYDDRILSTKRRVSRPHPNPLLKGDGIIQVSSTPKSSSSEKEKYGKGSGKAYSYVALVNGKIQTFKDWESCKAVVHGRSSKYKKVFSEQEEQVLKKEWGGK